MTTSKHSSALNKRKVRLLLDRELRNKYVSDQIKIGLRNQLRSLRHERKLTQIELAELIGTKQSVISRIERDPVRVGLPVFMDIAEKLDVAFVARFESIDTVVEWYDNPSVKKMTPRKSEEVLKDRARELLTTSESSSDLHISTILLDTPLRWNNVFVIDPKTLASAKTLFDWPGSTIEAKPAPFNAQFDSNLLAGVIDLENVDVQEEPKSLYDKIDVFYSESFDKPYLQ